MTLPGQVGYQPRNTPPERRAFYDLRRRMLAGDAAPPSDWTPFDERYVNIDGDTMTGQLILPTIRLTAVNDVHEASTAHAFQIGPTTGINLRMDDNEIMSVNNGVASPLYLYLPHVTGVTNVMTFGATLRQMINLYNTSYGIGVQGSALYHRSAAGHIWYRGGVHSDTLGDPGAGGVELMHLTTDGKMIIVGNNGADVLTLNGPPSANPFISLRNSGGTRLGYIGYPGTTSAEMRLINEAASSSIQLSTANAIYFVNGGAEVGRFVPGWFCVGRTSTSGYAEAGVLLNAASNYINSDALHGGLNMGHIGAADANGSGYIMFRRTTSGTQIGSITQTSTTGVAYNQTSDERLKDVNGPVRDAADRVRRLHPVNFTWKETGAKQDGFLAHEVQDVVPDAVCGERDAVDDDGAIVPMQLDQSRLIPLLTAALQQALDRIDILESRLAALEAR